MTLDPDLVGLEVEVGVQVLSESGELKKKHTSFPNGNSQSALQTTESYHSNSSRESQTGQGWEGVEVGWGGGGGVKEETLASERQVEAEKNTLWLLNHPSQLCSACFQQLSNAVRRTHAASITTTTTPAAASITTTTTPAAYLHNSPTS